MADKNKDQIKTTGHIWDGIEELDTPMPRWWLWTFYLTIIWGIGYCIAYPAWPLVDRATKGFLGYSTRAEVAEEIALFEAENAAIEARLVATDLVAISADPDLQHYASAAGGAVFRTWCAQCHGSGAAGARGYPNLLDDDWLWGGTLEEVYLTIRHGIRDEADLDSRYSQMPAFGDFMTKDEIAAMTHHVLSISGQDHDQTLAIGGATLFADNCASCHGDAGTGDRSQGAPDLTDSIWLWGGDEATLVETITSARFGVMPSWQSRLSESDIRAVSAYVHQLGGGE